MQLNDNKNIVTGTLVGWLDGYGVFHRLQRENLEIATLGMLERIRIQIPRGLNHYASLEKYVLHNLGFIFIGLNRANNKVIKFPNNYNVSDAQLGWLYTNYGVLSMEQRNEFNRFLKARKG